MVVTKLDGGLLDVSGVISIKLYLEKSRESAHCVFLLQNPTLAIAVDMRSSEASMIPATDMLPPNALRNALTAASVTSSFVCEESMRETSVVYRRFYNR
jgi:hypothetical protein